MWMEVKDRMRLKNWNGLGRLALIIDSKYISIVVYSCSKERAFRASRKSLKIKLPKESIYVNGITHIFPILRRSPLLYPKKKASYQADKTKGTATVESLRSKVHL